MKTNGKYQPGELQRVRRQFGDLLARTTSESEWQKFFAEYPYVLSESLSLRLDARDIIPMARPGKSDPDFIFYPREQCRVPFYGVIELKRPDSRIVTVKLGTATY